MDLIDRPGPPGTPTGSQLLAVLSAVLTALRDSGGYPDVLTRICRALNESVPCDRSTVYVWSRRRKAFLPAADHGTPAEVVQDFVRRGFGRGAFPGEDELRAGRAVFGVRGSTTPELEAILGLARLHALAVVPLFLHGRAEGTLSCGVDRPPAFRPEQVALLESVAPHIAALIQNARLQVAASRLADRRARIASWAAGVLEAGDMDEMTARLCDASRVLFGATRASLLLLDGESLVLRHAAGRMPDVPHSPFRIALDADSPPTDALRTRQVVVVNQFRRSRYANTPLGTLTNPAAVLAAPLIDAAGPLGVLTVTDAESPYRFGGTEAEDARLLASIATVSLRKGLLVEELRRASATKSEFLANVSHDLRTPLNVIIGYTQLLAEGSFGPVTVEQDDTLARILRTATDQVRLINDLLDLARIEHGKLACTFRAVAVAELLPSLRETMDVLLRNRPVRFEVAIAADAVATTDAERLRQILVNLLANAAKFTQEGCVRLAAMRAGEAVQVSVVDTGPGMDPSLGARAFEPFVRGGEGPTGAGLGLAIVARLVALLNGRLAIDTAPGRGTSVHLSLPAA